MHPLHAACKAGDSILVVNLTTPQNINELDENDLTPICHAAKAGHLGIVCYLATCGANLSGQSPQNLVSNIVYQASQCIDPDKQKNIFAWLLKNFDTLKFTDGTQKHHIKLALSLFKNHNSPSLDNPIYQDKLSFWIKAKFYAFATSESLQAKDHLEAFKCLNSSIHNYELYNVKTDQELRFYTINLQSLLLSIGKQAPSSEKLAIVKKMHLASEKVKKKDETDYSIQAYIELNLGDLHRDLDKVESAKRFYLIGLSNFLMLSAKAKEVFERLPDYFYGLTKCYPDKSQENDFYNIAIGCFTPVAKVKEKLIESLDKLINSRRFNPGFSAGVATLLEAIIHVYNVGLLKNEELANYINNDPTAAKKLESYLDTIITRLEAYNKRQISLQFFTSPQGTDKSTMNDNEPPENPDLAHRWTYGL